MYQSLSWLTISLNLGFKSIKTSRVNIGTLICWDQWFPEAARLTSILGAEIIFYPTAIGWHPKEKKSYGKSQLESWISIQRSHAIANGIYIAAVNRVGLEKMGSKTLEFWGNSIIFDPSGNSCARIKNSQRYSKYTQKNVDDHFYVFVLNIF